MGNDHLDQEPPEVQSAGTALSATAQSAVLDLRICLDPSTEAANAHAGWASAPPLGSCTGAWFDHLSALIEQTDHAAGNLRAAAAEYVEADRRATAALTDFEWRAN